MKTQFWLADGQKVDSYGTIWDPKLLDGPHDSESGVAEAKKLIQGMGLDRGLNRNYVMVAISEVPAIDVPVNEEAMAACKEMIDFAHRKK